MNLFVQLALALALGLLVGFQREWAAKRVAGIRTFPLITVFGALCALLARDYGGWIPAVGLLAVAGMVLMANYVRLRQGGTGAGATTEAAALVMFLVGAAIVAGYTGAAIAVSGALAVLLQWKAPMHEFVARVGREELRAIMRLVLIGLVILPILPNESFGPYQVLNPFRMWSIVVLIVSISMGAYIVQRWLGGRASTLIAGLLGGVISSTATTVSYAGRARQETGTVSMAVVVILVASTVVFVRVLVEVFVVAPGSFAACAPPLLVMLGCMVLISAIGYTLNRKEMVQPSDPETPAGFKAALVFGLLYALVLLGVAFAKEHLGSTGLYAVSALSGLTDVDAITLSTGELLNKEQLVPSTGWRLILVGVLSNLAFKTGVVAVLGNRALLARLVWPLGAAFGAGALLLILWP